MISLKIILVNNLMKKLLFFFFFKNIKMYNFLIILVLAFIFIYYLDKKVKEQKPIVVTAPVSTPTPTPTPTSMDEEEVDNEVYEDFASRLDWTDVAKSQSIDPSIEESHSEYVHNTRQYSSGANFAAIGDDNNSDLFTNYLGFVRPDYIPIRSGLQQIPDLDNEVNKRNKHMTFNYRN